MFLKKTFFKNIDFVVFFLATTLSVIGLSLIYSFGGDNSIFVKQSISLGVAIILFFIVSNLDFYFLRNSNFIFALYSFTVFLLIALFFVGSEFSGAKSWFSFGFFAFQPTDLAKIILVLILARYFFKRHIEIKRIKHLFISAIYPLIFFGLLLLQPDFGSAMIIFFIWFLFILVVGIPKKYILFIFSVGAILVFILYNFVFADYQKNRILTFLDPGRDPLGAGYNILQANIALGSGEFWGKGISEGTQSRLEFLPQAETDFIFSAFGEEWGFLGILILFLIFTIIIYRLVNRAILGRSNFESLIIIGIAIYFFVNFVVHTGINLGIMPVTGTVMPFMSYGGSHLLFEFIALGIVNSVARGNRTFHREQLDDVQIIA